MAKRKQTPVGDKEPTLGLEDALRVAIYLPAALTLFAVAGTFWVVIVVADALTSHQFSGRDVSRKY